MSCLLLALCLLSADLELLQEVVNGYFEAHLKKQIKSLHQHSPCKGDYVLGPSHSMRLTSFIEALIQFEVKNDNHIYYNN